MQRRFGPYAVLVLLGLTHTAADRARGEFIADVFTDVVAVEGGLFRYDYNLTIAPASTLAAEVFSLDVAADADVTPLPNARGWDLDYMPGGTSLLWIAPFDAPILRPGESMMFSLLSSFGSGETIAIVLGFDDEDNPAIVLAEVQGPLVRPTVVPEPKTLGLFSIGGLFLVASQRLRGRHTPRRLKLSINF